MFRIRLRCPSPSGISQSRHSRRAVPTSRSHLELAFGARVGVRRILTPRAATSWSNFPEGQFSSGAVYYSDYRYQRHPQENMNLGRTFRMKEGYSLSVRAEFTNIFNRTFLNNPLANNFQAVQTRNPVTGLNSGGFGWISTATTSTQFGQPRSGTIVARFTF